LIIFTPTLIYSVQEVSILKHQEFFKILFSYKEEQDYVICRKMNGTADCNAKQNKPVSQRQE
jgi:hypothetical protein